MYAFSRQSPYESLPHWKPLFLFQPMTSKHICHISSMKCASYKNAASLTIHMIFIKREKEKRVTRWKAKNWLLLNHEGLPILRPSATSPCYVTPMAPSTEKKPVVGFSLASGWVSKPYEGFVSKKERGKHGFGVSCWQHLLQIYTTMLSRILLIEISSSKLFYSK